VTAQARNAMCGSGNSRNETIGRGCALLSTGVLTTRIPEHAGTIESPGVPLKQRPVLITRGHRRTLAYGSKGPKVVRLVLGTGVSAGQAGG